MLERLFVPCNNQVLQSCIFDAGMVLTPFSGLFVVTPVLKLRTGSSSIGCSNALMTLMNLMMIVIRMFRVLLLVTRIIVMMMMVMMHMVTFVIIIVCVMNRSHL